jgi:hypothetical protein
MKKMSWILLFVAPTFACTTEPGADLSGLWDFTEERSTSTGVTCNLSGEWFLDQAATGNRFSGQLPRDAECTGDILEDWVNTLNGTEIVINGQISGLDVTFEMDFCEYEGTVNEPQVSGTLTCDLTILGESVAFTGTWQATRQ